MDRLPDRAGSSFEGGGMGFVSRLTWHFAKWFGTFRREGDKVQVVVPFTNIMGFGAGRQLILQD